MSIYIGTIGFGDLVPGASVVGNSSSQEKLAICSLYLLAGIILTKQTCWNITHFAIIPKGMALLAMCFNLMQEEVIHKIRLIGKKLGIINDCDDDEDDDDKFIDELT